MSLRRVTARWAPTSRYAQPRPLMSARSIGRMDDDGYDERPPLVHTGSQVGIPRDAQLMGFDRNTEEGALIAMTGSLSAAKPFHKIVAWMLMVAFSLPLLLTVWYEIF